MNLWKSSDCAALFGVTVKQFRDRIKPLPTFPKPVHFPTTIGASQPRWKPEEVIAWQESNLGTKAEARRRSGKSASPTSQPA